MNEERLARQPGFVTRRVAGETVVVPVLTIAQRPGAGGPQLDFVVLNETAELLWAKLASPSTILEMARELMTLYQIPEQTALADCLAFVGALKEIGAVATTE